MEGVKMTFAKPCEGVKSMFESGCATRWIFVLGSCASPDNPKNKVNGSPYFTCDNSLENWVLVLSIGVLVLSNGVLDLSIGC